MSDVEDDYTLEEDDTIHVSHLEIGDILEFKRKVGPITYHHCGNYAGNNMVIHKGLAPGVFGVQAFYEKWNNAIRSRIDSIQDVARGSTVYRNNMFDDTIRPSKEEVILRAKAMIGEADYNLFFSNCQHFCTKLRYDSAFSREADMILKLTFFTSTRHIYTNKMVQVLIDDDESSDMINKYEQKDRFDLSYIGNPSENKNHFDMICGLTDYIRNFESQTHNTVLKPNTGILHDLFDMSIETRMLKTIPRSFEIQPYNAFTLSNSDLIVNSNCECEEVRISQRIYDSVTSKPLIDIPNWLTSSTRFGTSSSGFGTSSRGFGTNLSGFGTNLSGFGSQQQCFTPALPLDIIILVCLSILFFIIFLRSLVRCR